MRLKNKEDIENYNEKAEFLKQNGWEISWDDDNWVRSNSRYKEANNGISTDAAYNLVMEEKRREEQYQTYLENQKAGKLKSVNQPRLK